MKFLTALTPLIVLAITSSYSLAMASNDDHDKKSKSKINFKAHVVEGSFASTMKKGKAVKNSRLMLITSNKHGLIIRLHPRTTMATDDNGKPLKCKAFVIPHSIKQTDFRSTILRREELVRVIDIARQNPLVRLEGVERKPGTYKDYCIARSLTSIDEQGQKFVMPAQKYKFTLEDKNDKNTNMLNSEYNTCLTRNKTSNPYIDDRKGMEDISQIDFCSCWVLAYRDFPMEKYKKLSARQQWNQRAGQSTAYCMNPKAYQ